MYSPFILFVPGLLCIDCELVALLEDDSGMELLVANKIISLDLPVKDVYKKVWLAQSSNVSIHCIVTMYIVHLMLLCDSALYLHKAVCCCHDNISNMITLHAGLP